MIATCTKEKTFTSWRPGGDTVTPGRGDPGYRRDLRDRGGVRACPHRWRRHHHHGTSVAGLRGGGHEAVYAATKSAQVGLAGALDRELAPRGIRVTGICPAATRPEFAMGYGRTPGMPGMDGWLTADDVAGAVVTVLRQPRRMRTQLWTMWSMSEVG